MHVHESSPEASEADLAEQAVDAFSDLDPDPLPPEALDGEADAADVVDQLRAAPFDEESF